MQQTTNRSPLIIGIIALIIGYAVASAQHFFTVTAIKNELQNSKDDVRNLKTGREAIEKRANRLEAQVYIERAIDNVSNGDESSARALLGNAAVFFENGVVTKDSNQVAVLESIRSTRDGFSKESLLSLRQKLAKLTPVVSAVAGGASQ